MKTLKKMMSFILVLSMALSLFAVTASATEEGDATIGGVMTELEGNKGAKLIDRESNLYTVSVDVPGGDPDTRHDEVILMVDGSYSGDVEWPAMKNAINTIGQAVLNGAGNTMLTLMAFGMGDNEVIVHAKDAAELEAVLGDLPGNLLRGVSSTNCECGFTGIAEYIDNHDDSLKDAIVLYITDGGINTDETPRLFYDWASYAPNVNNVTKYALNGTSVTELNGVTKDDPVAFTNEVWKAVFAHSNMDINTEYPISEMERAFLQYDEDHGTTVRNSFLIAMKSSAYDKYPNVRQRTYDSVFALAQCPEVQDLYLVRYQMDGRATWMPDAAAAAEDDNIHYVQSDSISTLVGSLSELVPELSKTPYNDVYVTDYMSKWVNLDLNSIRIYDGETLIYAYNEEASAYEWLVEEALRPTAKTPIIVELVDPSAYEAGGDDVIGNTSGNIYKITWNIKDGALVRADNFHLEYDVTVDTDEEGFQYNTDYPANGNTDVHHTDSEGEEHTTPVDVPDVKVPRTIPTPSVTYHSVTVNYYDKATNAKIANSFLTMKAEGSSYDVSAKDAIAIDGYTYDSTSGDALSGVMDSDKVINVYYVQDGDDVVNIPDEDVPTSDTPSVPEDLEDLEEPDVPLADVPKTGDSCLWIMMSLLSAMGLGVLTLTERKRSEI